MTTRMATPSFQATLTAGLAGLAITEPPLSWSGSIQPVGLHRARVAPDRYRGHGYLERPDRDFREELQGLWMAARLVRPLTEELAVVMTFAGCSRVPRRPRARRSCPDLTNLLKAVEDAGNRFLWVDDKQIRILLGHIVAWGPDVTPWITVDAWPMGQAA
jgi:Holliday junction resolvase RusA-like endonuclease